MRAHIITDGKISNTIEVESLDFLPGLIDAEIGGGIGDIWDGESFSKPIPPAPTLDECKAELAKIRYEHEIGGTAVAGITITTDREDQAMLNSAYTAVQLDPAKVIDYKTTNGWVQVDASTITEMSRAVIDHVQACFTRERELSGMLDVDIDTDLNVGWPSA